MRIYGEDNKTPLKIEGLEVKMQDSPNPTRHHLNGGATTKRLKPPQTPWFVPPNHLAIRLLCHVSRVGGLIGKSGSIIRQLQQETTAKIRVEDLPNSASPTPSHAHRVILIIGSISVSKKITLKLNAPTIVSEMVSEDQEIEVGGDDDGEGVGEVEVSAVQEAVVRVFERVIEVAAEREGGGDGVAVEGIVSCRLLVEKGQVGVLIGKGGKTIEMIKREAGCRIKVLNKERLPSCAMPNDEMVEIEGDIIAVKKALIGVARCLQDCPVNKGRSGGGRSFEQVQQEATFDPRMDLPMHRSAVAPPMPTTTSSNGYPSGGQSMFVEGERAATVDSRASIREVIFNILCPNDRVGGVIGKGGSIVKNLEIETSTAISVGPTVAESAERLITISAMENPESRYSPAQSAVIVLFSRFLTSAVDKNLDSSSKQPQVSARLLVQSNDVGCLLGKGGTIISEMRKLTGAGLRIIGGDQVPKCAIGNVEVVQITGSFGSVQNALYSVTSRLRDNLSPSKIPNTTGSRTVSSFPHGNNPYGGGRGPASVERHPSADFSLESGEHGALVNNMDQLRLGPGGDSSPSPTSWTPQPIPGANQRSSGEIGRGPTNIKGGVEIGSGTRSAIVTNTTVEIVVPDNVIDSIYGENGSNLSRLRLISGAKVIVHNQEPGSTDRVIVISGSPEQTQAAQSLLQAFILQDLDDN